MLNTPRFRMSQVSGIETSKTIQREHTDCLGFPEATLLHRQRRRDVQAYSELHAEFAPPDS